jgi:predicted RNase H-like nuclease (RuvC/YqgF family)
MVDESQKASGDSQHDIRDIQVKDSVSYDSHKKLLGEKKALQTKFEHMQTEIESHRQDKLSAEGKKDDVITSLRKQLDDKSKEAKELKNNFAWNTIQGQIKNEASAQGCVNPNKLIKLLSKYQIGGIEIDDEFNVNVTDLTKLISDAKKEHSDIGLFSERKINVSDVQGKAPKPKTKGFDDMTQEELTEELKKLES